MSPGTRADTAAGGEPWYVSAFGADYLRRYAHRDSAEAGRATRALAAPLALTPRSRVLDAACGAGRYVEALLDWGVRDVVGIDLSQPLLDEAARQLAPHLEAGRARLVQGDLRALPFPDGTAESGFDVVVSFFTSFGYFDDDADNARVAAEALRVLRPGGRYLVDVANLPQALAALVAHECADCDDEGVVRASTDPGSRAGAASGGTEAPRGHSSLRVRTRRWFDRQRLRFEKRVQWIAADAYDAPEAPAPVGSSPAKPADGGDTDTDDGQVVRELRESVRVYEPLELQALLADAGFVIRHVFGGYDAGPLTAQSKRCIVIGVKP